METYILITYVNDSQWEFSYDSGNSYQLCDNLKDGMGGSGEVSEGDICTLVVDSC